MSGSMELAKARARLPTLAVSRVHLARSSATATLLYWPKASHAGFELLAPIITHRYMVPPILKEPTSISQR
jgi:hypothetical protein